MPCVEEEDNEKIINRLLSIIQKEQEYTPEEMQLFRKIESCNDAKVAPNTHYVRLISDDIVLDFICVNPWGNTLVEEANFLRWPIDFEYERKTIK